MCKSSYSKKKSLKIIWRKWQTIPARSLKKWEPSKKHPKNKLSLVTELEEPKTSSIVKPRRWNNFIVKFQNLKHKIVFTRVNNKEMNVKNNLKLIICQTSFFLQKKSSKFQYHVVWQFMLATLYTPIVYPKCIGSGIQTTVKPNELSSVLTVRRYGLHNGVMAYMLQFGESTIHRIFVTWVAFMKAIFSMLKSQTWLWIFAVMLAEVFNKTGHGLTGIIKTWEEFKPVLHPEIFGSITVHISTVCWGLYQKCFRTLEYLNWFKNGLSSLFNVFLQTLF